MSNKNVQWSEAIIKAQEAVQVLLDIQSDCQGKYDSMSEKWQEGPIGSALNDVCELDLQGMLDTLDECDDLEIKL